MGSWGATPGMQRIVQQEAGPKGANAEAAFGQAAAA